MNTASIATEDYADGLSPIDPQTLLQSPGMQKPTCGPGPWGHLAPGETESLGWEAPIAAAHEARVRREFTTGLLPRRPVVLNRRAQRYSQAMQS